MCRKGTVNSSTREPLSSRHSRNHTLNVVSFHMSLFTHAIIKVVVSGIQAEVDYSRHSSICCLRGQFEDPETAQLLWFNPEDS